MAGAGEVVVVPVVVMVNDNRTLLVVDLWLVAAGAVASILIKPMSCSTESTLFGCVRGTS